MDKLTANEELRAILGEDREVSDFLNDALEDLKEPLYVGRAAWDGIEYAYVLHLHGVELFKATPHAEVAQWVLLRQSYGPLHGLELLESSRAMRRPDGPTHWVESATVRHPAIGELEIRLRDGAQREHFAPVGEMLRQWARAKPPAVRLSEDPK